MLSYPHGMSPFLRKLLIGTGIAVVGLGAFTGWVWYGNPTAEPIEQFEGTKPRIVDPQPEKIPSIAVYKPIGWDAGAAPQAAPGMQVTRFAEGLAHPRTLYTLPNGDVLAALTGPPKGNDEGGIIGFFQRTLVGFVGGGDTSADEIVLLRDSKGTGKADQRFVLRHDDLHSPSGMAYADGKLYIANDDAVLSFDYKIGDTTLTGKPHKVMDLPGGGNHWMRNLLMAPDGKTMFVAIGSASNIGERGMKAEEGRAMIEQIDIAKIATGKWPARRYAAGMRNPNGMAWNPATNEMWAVVNERDQLGPNLVPDYLTNVPAGVHYGWPWYYWKDKQDDRVDAPIPEYLTDYVRKPEYAMGPHVAALGLVFGQDGSHLGEQYASGAFIARHGSWNRRPAVGYDVVFVQFDDHGNPQGLPKPILTGFRDSKGAHGRPVWLQWAKDGALLVSDDTAGIIWRVFAPGAKPAVAPKPLPSEHLPAPKDLKDPNRQYSAGFQADSKVKQ
jgi:glucose/arabinose dehydrogenase